MKKKMENKLNYKPFFGQIITNIPEVKKKTKGGIYITDAERQRASNRLEDVNDDAKCFKILAMADDVQWMLEKRAKESGLPVESFPQVGDYVYTYGDGIRMKIEGKEIWSMSVNNIIGKKIYNPEPVEEEVEIKEITI